MLTRALPLFVPSLSAEHRTSGRSTLLLGAALLLLAIVMLRSAWLSDDGLITFRTLDHFVNGEGLRFNLAERVQSYTHPLWLFLLAPFYYVSREAFYTPLLVSLTVSSLAVLLYAGATARSYAVAAAGVCCLTASKAFVDYTTSGLETPLTYLLLAAWLQAYFAFDRMRHSATRFGVLVAISSLLFLNRMDSVLLVAPGLLAAGVFWLRGEGSTWRGLLLPLAGALPAVAWLGFSIFYYGTPLANTAYAKLATGIDPALLRAQGLFYVTHALRSDPVTPVAIALALAVSVAHAFKERSWLLLSIGAGLAVTVGYVIEIGGDFMMGRFLAAPFFVAVIVLSRLAVPHWMLGCIAGACILASLSSPLSPLRAGSDYVNRDEQEIIENRGISDERGFYYLQRGLLASAPEKILLPGANCGEEAQPVVIRTVCGDLGHAGFTGCRALFLADRCALSDPLLARMPMIDPTRWRVGHYFRRVPRGYRESLVEDANRIVDPRVYALYDDIRAATRAPLFETGRLAAILRLNTHDYGIQE